MLKITRIRGDGSYFLDLATTDYYTQGGEPPGYWLGEGAAQLGLKDKPITRDGLRNILKGFSIDGKEKLVQNAGKPGRHKGYDFTFNAPKDVSVLWAASPRWMQMEIQKAHDRAVSTSINYLQEHALFTRRGKEGQVVEHAKAIVAAYEHCTSRAEEPHLHTHCLLANICIREDGTFGTFYGRVVKDENGQVIDAENPLFDHMKAAGAVYQLALATELKNGLGLDPRPAENGFSFEVERLSREPVDFYSTRRKEIEELMQMKGFASAEAAEIANYETRKQKREIFRKELFERWGEELAQFGLTQDKAEGFCNQLQSLHDYEKEIADAIQAAHQELTEDRGGFPLADLYERTANHLVASGVAFQDVHKAIQKEIVDGSLISLGTEKMQRVLSNQETLTLEDNCTKQMDQAQENASHMVSGYNVAKAIEETEKVQGFTYDKEYCEAISYLTTGITAQGRNVGANRVLIGDAGSGKTTLLRTVKNVFEKEGYRVVGTALPGKATDELQNKAEIPSATLAKWNYELKKTPWDDLKHETRMYARAAQNKTTWQNDTTLTLDKKTVLVIDEAAMTDTPQLYKLYERAQEAGSIVIWSGDDKQCQAIGHGGAFSLAARMSDAVRISDNFRQRHPEDKELAKLASQGTSKELLQNLADRDKLHVQATKDKSIKNLVDDWSKAGVRHPQSHHIFVGTHQDRVKINAECQQKRIAAYKRFLGVGIKNHEGQKLFKGDYIVFQENLLLKNQYQKFGTYLTGKLTEALTHTQQGAERVRTGQFGTILTVNPLSKELRVKMDDGRLLSVPTSIRDESKKNILGAYHTDIFGEHIERKTAISLGYATTIPAGQGSEFENTYHLVGGPMQDRELTYVQVTRHQEVTNVYTTEGEAGKELALKSLLSVAKRAGEFERVAELKKKLAEAERTKGDRAEDSLLAKRMKTSHRKEFALYDTEKLAAEAQRQRQLEEEQQQTKGHEL